MISESNLVQHMLKGKDIKKIQESKVDEFMDPPYPIVDESTPINLIMAILTFYNAVLVSHQGKVIGIITRSDILKG